MSLISRFTSKRSSDDARKLQAVRDVIADVNVPNGTTNKIARIVG